MTRPGDDAVIRVPGDKSISHRALLLAAIAEGESRLAGLLPGADCRSTAQVLRRLGVEVPSLPVDGAALTLTGAGAAGFRQPGPDPLDCGNSGTTVRLLLGLLAGSGVEATLTGDASLRARPMRRVTMPLERMGARFHEEGEPDRLPIRVLGRTERAIHYRSPVASAQVKSALLLAGLAAGVGVTVIEPARSRDHTERMLRRCGVPVDEGPAGPDGGWRVHLPAPGTGAASSAADDPDPAKDPNSVQDPNSAQGPNSAHAPNRAPWRLAPLDLTVPGDFSSAVFPLALALVGGAAGGTRLASIGVNPTRTGLLPVLERMGALVELENASGLDDLAAEPTADLVVRRSPLRGTEVSVEELPLLVDEVPILAILGARARGRTVIRGAAELRVKESDRIDALVVNLRGLGVEVEEFEDGLAVTGSDRPLRGTVDPRHDHRIAMAFGILGALPGNRIQVSNPATVEVSFPGFWEELAVWSGSGAASAGGRPRPVVTIDGPAGSGKSSTARAVAAALGFRHLDSGALFRAVTLGLLRSDRPEGEWDQVDVEELEAMAIELVPGDQGFEVRLGGEVLDEALRSPAVTDRVARVATIPAVRDWLLRRQREAARRGGVVVDGRDTGSVVFPEADVKVFLTAGLEERARRRLLQDRGDGASEPSPDEIRTEAQRLATRDRNDQTRELAPLRRPEGAIDVDTTALSFDEQVNRVVREVRTVERDGG